MRIPAKKETQMLQLHNIPSKMMSPKKADAWEMMRKMGYFRDMKTIELADISWVIDYWKDQPAYVIGSSPGLRNMIDDGFNLSMLDNCNTISCNHIIEDWDKMKIFLFLDQHFLDSTTYNLRNYQGKLFVRNNVNLFSGDLPYPFYRFMARRPREGLDDDIINKGLYCDLLAGICCLHLAILSGADPICLIGMDTGKVTATNKYHYKENYRGAFKINMHYTSQVKRNNTHSPFTKYADRILNVDPFGVIKYYKKINWKQMTIEKPIINTITEIKQNPIICHVTRFNSPGKWNEISRQIFSMTEGRHIFSNIMDIKQPKADIYFVECIINGSKEFINFQKPAGSKVISLIHSTSKCLPAICSDKIVVLSSPEQRRMKAYNLNSIIIPCAIDLQYYNHEIDYSKKTYGRITRYSPGKLHPRFNAIVDHIKTVYPDSHCIIVTKTGLKNPNIEYIETIENPDNQGKARELSRMTMFTDYHGIFVETFSIALLEAMASSLCIVLYSIAPQASMIEVLGGTGIICNDEKSFINTIIKLLPDAQAKKEFGTRARARAKEFSIEKMVKSYNALFQEVLK
jgi:glycosyltransferase involved in cell wall biosynthesis